MLIIIVLGVLLGITLIAFIASLTSPVGSDARVGAAFVSVVGLVLFVVLFLCQSVKVVGVNEVGASRTFGTLNAPLQSGVHMVKPWTDVTKYPTRPESFEVVANVRTNQSGTVAVRIKARWATERTQVNDLYTQTRKDAGKIEKDLITPNTQGAAGAFYGSLDNLQAVNGINWEANADGVEVKLADYLRPYGIKIDQVQILEVNPSDSTDRAIALIATQQNLTTVAAESKQTAIQQAAQQKQAALGLKNAANELKDLTPLQLQLLCLQAGERIANGNTAKGVPTYSLPCQSGVTSVIGK